MHEWPIFSYSSLTININLMVIQMSFGRNRTGKLCGFWMQAVLLPRMQLSLTAFSFTDSNLFFMVESRHYPGYHGSEYTTKICCPCHKCYSDCYFFFNALQDFIWTKVLMSEFENCPDWPKCPSWKARLDLLVDFVSVQHSVQYPFVVLCHLFQMLVSGFPNLFTLPELGMRCSYHATETRGVDS